jgi:hypothetical protein
MLLVKPACIRNSAKELSMPTIDPAVCPDADGPTGGPCPNSDELPRREPGASQHRPSLTTEEATLLRELQSIWHDRYAISADDGWCAQRLGGSDLITADSGFQLRSMLTRDAINWNRERISPIVHCEHCEKKIMLVGSVWYRTETADINGLLSRQPR